MSKNTKRFKERSNTREQLMQLLYQMEAQNDFSDRGKEAYMKSYIIEDSEREYFDNLYDAAVNNKEDIDKLIEKYSKNWSIGRISKVDLSIIRLAIAEIQYSDIPDSVSINEAVEMAKKFGGEDSGKFVNGILGEIARSKDN